MILAFYKEIDENINKIKNIIKEAIEISNIIKEFYVDISKYDEILKQFHLLRDYEQIIVQIFKISNKITNIYFNAYPISYFSNILSKRKKFEYNLEDFNKLSKSQNKINVNYQGVYMSVFNILDNNYFIEHNELLDDNEIKKLNMLKINN